MSLSSNRPALWASGHVGHTNSISLNSFSLEGGLHLIILAEEVLSNNLLKRVHNGKIHPIYMTHGSPTICRLFFADDIFCSLRVQWGEPQKSREYKLVIEKQPANLSISGRVFFSLAVRGQVKKLIFNWTLTFLLPIYQWEISFSLEAQNPATFCPLWKGCGKN